MFKNYSVPIPTFGYTSKKILKEHLVSVYQRLGAANATIHEASFNSEYEAFTYGETLVKQLEEDSAANLVRLYNTIRLHVTCNDKSQLGLRLFDPARKVWVREGLTESFKAPSGPTPKLLEVDASRHPVFGSIR